MSAFSCPVCDTATLLPRRYGRTEMLLCPVCSALVTPEHLRATKAASYYEEQYSLTRTVRTNKEMHRYFRYPEYASLIGEISRECPPPGRWLDVGCDNGFFLDDARRYGYHVQGVEPSTSARDYAHHIGLNVQADLSDVNDAFDVVSLWHVLEHMDRPVPVLSELRDKLHPGGLLCVRVPNTRSFWARALRDRWIWFQPHHHLVHYEEKTLRMVLERSGFTPLFIKAQRPNTKLTRRAYRLSNQVFHETQGRPLPSIKDRAARWYQDLTGHELFAIARRT